MEIGAAPTWSDLTKTLASDERFGIVPYGLNSGQKEAEPLSPPG